VALWDSVRTKCAQRSGSSGTTISPSSAVRSGVGTGGGGAAARAVGSIRTSATKRVRPASAATMRGAPTTLPPRAAAALASAHRHRVVCNELHGRNAGIGGRRDGRLRHGVVRRHRFRVVGKDECLPVARLASGIMDAHADAQPFVVVGVDGKADRHLPCHGERSGRCREIPGSLAPRSVYALDPKLQSVEGGATRCRVHFYPPRLLPNERHEGVALRSAEGLDLERRLRRGKDRHGEQENDTETVPVDSCEHHPSNRATSS